MKKIKIIGYTSEICWWMGSIGQTSPVLEVYEPTGFIKIKVTRTEVGFEPYEIQGWIDSQYVEEIYD